MAQPSPHKALWEGPPIIARATSPQPPAPSQWMLPTLGSSSLLAADPLAAWFEVHFQTLAQAGTVQAKAPAGAVLQPSSSVVPETSPTTCLPASVVQEAGRELDNREANRNEEDGKGRQPADQPGAAIEMPSESRQAEADGQQQPRPAATMLQGAAQLQGQPSHHHQQQQQHIRWCPPLPRLYLLRHYPLSSSKAAAATAKGKQEQLLQQLCQT
ncbi:hypothetical protein HaLaN_11522 [Haematococcus lacustris]|uniref:Uncharacterized protein n=1 Tax=Haematococcus lacustris TaxID=44745 RepID=A0A699Z868_HAELA|nr:hypothetical protein HaLaN_11522 [Haematococcus lacustris]